MARTLQITLDDIKDRIARNLSEYRVQKTQGEIGQLTVWLRPAATRTFRAHWTGFKLFYPGKVVAMTAELRGGALWAEAYVSPKQPSWVLAFRGEPHPARGSSGRARPDDELASPQALEIALGQRRLLEEQGVIPTEELIRMEDFDDPLRAVDQFFNYTALYVLRAVDATWAQLGYAIDSSMGWDRDEDLVASVPADAAIEEALKKSDIIWVHPDTADRPVPCWFVAKDGKIFVLSGETVQTLPDANRIRLARVTARWKGRDAQLVGFQSTVRVINATDEIFDELATLLVAKRQSVRGSQDEVIERWKRECVILELTPR